MKLIVTPEDLFLLHTAKCQITGNDKAKGMQLINQGIDWRRLAFKTGFHGVTGLVVKNTKKILEEEEECLKNIEGLELQACREFIIQEELEKELVELIKSMKKRFSLILLKGLSLNKIIYKSNGLRSTTDLDVLVKAEEYEALKKELLRMGCREKNPNKGIFLPDNMQYGYHQQFITPKNKILEVHWALVPKRKAMKIDYRQVWENTSKIKLKDELVLALNQEAMLWYLSLHLCTGPLSLYYLKNVVDIHELANQEIDWEKFVRLSKKTKTSHYQFAALMMAKDFFNAKIPSQVLQALKPNFVYRSLYAAIRKNFFRLNTLPIFLTKNLSRAFRFMPFPVPL